MNAVASSLIAFVFYASWSLVVNYSDFDAVGSSIRHASVQGGYSALMTYVLSKLVEYSYRVTACWKRVSLSMTVPAAFQSLFAYVVASANLSPSPLLTAAPSIFFGSAYCIFYVRTLARTKVVLCMDSARGRILPEMVDR